METFNGRLEEQLLLCYAGLLSSGRIVTPTGVSDSHHRIPEAGMARTYLRTDAGVTTFDDAAFVAAMRAHGTIVSTGPFIDLVVRNDSGASAGPGGTIAAGGAPLRLSMRVVAPSWIEVERVALYGGESCPDATGECAPLRTWTTTALGDGVWLELVDESLTVGGDTWVFARADGSRDMGPVYPGRTPFAHTAAILIDAP